MLRFDSEVTIRRRVADVFAFVADLSNTPLWQQGVVHSESITPGPIRVGHMFDEDVKVAWFHVATRCVVTELEANQRMVFEASSSPLEYRAEFWFEPVDGGTRLRVRGSGRMRGVWRLLEPVLQADATRTAKDEVGRIKSHLEAVAA
jgi:uncharacterized protein YndB with AHSA1/START domain